MVGGEVQRLRPVTDPVFLRRGDLGQRPPAGSAVFVRKEDGIVAESPVARRLLGNEPRKRGLKDLNRRRLTAFARLANGDRTAEPRPPIPEGAVLKRLDDTPVPLGL